MKIDTEINGAFVNSKREHKGGFRILGKINSPVLPHQHQEIHSSYENPGVDYLFKVRECSFKVRGKKITPLLFLDTQESNDFRDLPTFYYLINLAIVIEGAQSIFGGDKGSFIEWYVNKEIITTNLWDINTDSYQGIPPDVLLLLPETEES